MEEEKNEKGMATSESTDLIQEFQEALDECLDENEKLRAELATNKRDMCKLEEKVAI